ncbi:MAG: hypothetical protein HW380_3140 [Magnetococcales bacterium]|nr:hypothetical protein [Magnetococcales bacterium]
MLQAFFMSGKYEENRERPTNLLVDLLVCWLRWEKIDQQIWGGASKMPLNDRMLRNLRAC